MTQLDRAAVRAMLQGYLDGQHNRETLSAWAFDQFYAEAEGQVTIEPGYRKLTLATLDDLMFSDDPRFGLDPRQVAAMIARLDRAVATFEDESDDDFDDEDED